MPKPQIFIIERSGEPVGAMRIEETETRLLIHKSRSVGHTHDLTEFAPALSRYGVGCDLEALQREEL